MGSIPTTLQGSVTVPTVVYEQFKVEQFTESTILAGNDISDPILLLNLAVVKDPNETVSKISTLDDRITGLGIRDTGAGTVRLGIITSDDGGATWSQGTVILFSGAVFGSGAVNDNNLNIGGDDLTNIAVAVFNNDGITTGRIKELVANILIKLPLNYTLVKQ